MHDAVNDVLLHHPSLASKPNPWGSVHLVASLVSLFDWQHAAILDWSDILIVLSFPTLVGIIGYSESTESWKKMLPVISKVPDTVSLSPLYNSNPNSS